MSVCLSVHLSVRHILALYQNEQSYSVMIYLLTKSPKTLVVADIRHLHTPVSHSRFSPTTADSVLSRRQPTQIG